MAEKSELRVRWLVLFLSCVLMIGNYYCFDNPAALKSQLQQHFNNIPKDRYEFLFFGRVVFGFGGESLGVAQGTLVASWFKNSELALALGINLSVARLGSVINNELSPIVAQASSVSAALWVGVIMCVASTFTVLLVIPIDKRAEKMTKENQKEGVTAAESIHFSDIKHFRPAFWLLALSCLVVYGCVIPFNNVASSLLMERDFFKEPPELCRRCGEGLYIGEIDCQEIVPGCPSVPPYGWPLPLLSANYVVEAKHVGTAYGAITAIQVRSNIGLALFPLAVAAEFNHDDRYIPGVELLFVSFGVLGSLVGIALNVVDYQNGSILNHTNAKKRRVSLMLDEDALDQEALLAAEH
ncbi:hypothetical protein AM588_10005061 [Phytophthora nicotianae]|uniref:Lysosomal dipeptide transporter MFSD1 n=1 Tax=Phytophthora nicotianae TaxID=4792 RepID=A0A0W8DF39_PHYNI|nr:hypothetical protein AM588_10005061 [Phytophthora nicotianae]